MDKDYITNEIEVACDHLGRAMNKSQKLWDNENLKTAKLVLEELIEDIENEDLENSEFKNDKEDYSRNIKFSNWEMKIINSAFAQYQDRLNSGMNIDNSYFFNLCNMLGCQFDENKITVIKAILQI